MNTEDRITLRIEKVVYRGSGLARLDGLAVFVPGTIEGELVEARIVERKKNFARASLIRILEPSPFRIEPKCGLAVVPSEGSLDETVFCPGCSYQHIAYDEEVRIKNQQFTEMIGHKTNAPDDVFLPPVQSPMDIGYRNKITLHSCNGKDGFRLGYLGPDNRTIIDIPECPLAIKPINDLLTDLRDKSGLMASLKDGENIVLRYSEDDGAHYKTETSLPTLNMLSERTSIGTVKVPFSSFFQVNPAVADHLVKAVSEMLRNIKPATVADLYCGVGIFGFVAAESEVEHIISVDSDPGGVAAAVQNAKDLGFENIKFMPMNAEEGLKKIRNEFSNDNTCIVIDPPRTGLEKPVMERLLEFGPSNVIYVSCAADTLARDLEILCGDNKYKIISSRLFDMFPRTPYFESVTRLKKI